MLEDAISAAEERKAKAKTRTRWPFGYKGEPDDVPIPEGKTSAVISRLLERAEVDAGEFSVGGQADVLPSIPGLFIGGIDGCVPVPLTEERKYQILSVCEANVTKKTQDDIDIDGNSNNTWTLSPDQVKMKNPEWESGMQKLTQLVGDRLGFKRMKLTCEMKSLVVHGPGAKMRKQQKTKEDGVVATLVVQLPSEHSGGDLVVYRGRDVEFRHDFGVQKGVAAYLPHYAAYFADAPCARVEVTSGFQLMLTYALSLPVEMKYLEGVKGDIPLSDELAEVLKEVEPEDECFGLLLESEYSEITILSKGAEALSEMDNTSLECGEAQTALLRRVVEKASSIAPEKLVECESRKLLWKCAVRSEDVTVLEMVVGHFKKIKPNNLDRVIDAASEYTDALDTQDKKFTIIASLAELRMEWLNKKLDKLDKPFTWEMPDASFIDNARVQAFLRGLESTMTTRGLVYFRNQRHAQRWTRHKQTKASFELIAEGTGREAFVTIAKTRRHYEAQQNRVEKFIAEKEKLLVKRFKDPAGKDSASSTGNKRPREEEEDIAME
ncbi:hypothetical protein KRP22_002171 [Phytophthora ramorum]|nr:hypothetical protein KRP22_1454 [Phytophthora ramorum]